MSDTPYVDKATMVIDAAVTAAGSTQIVDVMEVLVHAIMVVSTHAQLPRPALQEVADTLARAAANMPANLAKETPA